MNIKAQVGLLVPYLLFLLLGAFFSLTFTQNQISLAINSNHQPIFDFLNKYGTYLGDGFFIIVIALILFLFDKKLALTILLSYAISSVLVQTLKHTVFSDFHRPMHYLSQISGIHLIEGVEMNYHNSFPSGHTTAAFSFFIVFALYFKEQWLKSLFVFIAIFVAFTRIYLLQHFLIDTLIGSIVGSTFAFLFYYLIFIKDFKFPFKKYANS
jgi:membrane-associated phospholipid phosphatase